MFGKTVRLLLLLGIAGAAPYAWYNDGFTDYVLGAARDNWRGWAGKPGSLPALGDLQTTSFESDQASAATADPRMAKRPQTNDDGNTLEEVLRFDIDDHWVVSRWPRVSTILTAQHRQGMRVALVTGTARDDLAGSLSYYFDKHRRVRRISFEGHTGDASEIVNFAATQFGLRPEPTIKAGLYLARWNGYPVSGLYVRHAPVVRKHAPRTRMEVRFEINRPDAGYALSDEFLGLLNLEWLTRDRMPGPLPPARIREPVLPHSARSGGH